MGMMKRATVGLPIIKPNKSHDWGNFYTVNKFGRAPDVDGAVDIWDINQDYTFLAVASTIYVSSSSASDTAITVTVQGLDADWNHISQDATCNGFAFVPLALPMIRVYRAFVSGAATPVGDIYISSDNTDAGGNGIPDTLSTVKALINTPVNQTLMCIYTVPAGYSAYVLQLSSSVEGAGTTKSVDIQLQTREFGKVFRVKREWGVTTTGQNPMEFTYAAPLYVSAKSDIKLRVSSASTTNMQVDATFALLLLPDTSPS